MTRSFRRDRRRLMANGGGPARSAAAGAGASVARSPRRRLLVRSGCPPLGGASPRPRPGRLNLRCRRHRSPLASLCCARFCPPLSVRVARRLLHFFSACRRLPFVALLRARRCASAPAVRRAERGRCSGAGGVEQFGKRVRRLAAGMRAAAWIGAWASAAERMRTRRWARRTSCADLAGHCSASRGPRQCRRKDRANSSMLPEWLNLRRRNRLPADAAAGKKCRPKRAAAAHCARPVPTYSKAMPNSLELEGRPQDTRVVVAMSGGVDSSVTAALLQGRGLRRRRRHPAALRPRGGDPPQGRLLRRPGHPRRPRGGRAHRHSALRARLREPLQGGGDRPLRRELCGGRDAGALRRLQHGDQVPRSARHGARARRPRAGDRALRCLARAAGRRPRALPRARGGARPELFPVRHHARAARSPALSARRARQGGDARAGAPLRAGGRRQARQPGHLLRADRQATPT